MIKRQDYRGNDKVNSILSQIAGKGTGINQQVLERARNDFFEFFVQMILVKVNVRAQILRISLEKYSFW